LNTIVEEAQLAEPGVKQKLVAIIAADVAGYTRLMADDEPATIATITEYRTIFRGHIEGNGGRVVDMAGDSILAVFASAAGAVKAAVDAQSELAARNQEMPDTRRMRFRVGVNLGDIREADDGTVYGDGVNVAARLEGLAEPGGIMLSEAAHLQVRRTPQLTFADAGVHELKNVDEPMRAYRVVSDSFSQDQAVASAADEVVRRDLLALPDKPSIAVLPFNNMSGDPDQEYFADGMTEDLTTDLSKVSGLFVVARNSTFAYKGQQVDIRKVARELGVRYVLEGSVRKAANRVRINAQLIDAVTSGHLWADRYDGTVDNVFELQDAVGESVISALSVALDPGERDRMKHIHTRNLEAYELYVRAKGTPYPPVRDLVLLAHKMFDTVIESDPDFAGGYSGASLMFSLAVMYDTSESPDKDINQAVAMAQRAIEVDETFGSSYTSLAVALLLRRDFDLAVEAAREAIQKQPSDADGHSYLATVLILAGQADEAVSPLKQAIRLNPQYHAPYFNQLGLAYLTRRHYHEAVGAFCTNVEHHGPLATPAMCWWAASYVGLDQMGDARDMMRRVLSESPDFSIASWNFPGWYKNVSDADHLKNALLSAGFPE
jgi:adenylate cyclase